MKLEGLLTGGSPNPEEPEPEEGFGDGDGPCNHPECGVERMMSYALETLVEGLHVFELQGWEMSPFIDEQLEVLRKALNEAHEEEAAPKMGEIFPIIKDRD